MNENNQLVTGNFQFTPFAIIPEGLQARANALASSALIGKVENAEQNNQCSRARKEIKTLLSLFESQRKKLKEPIIEAGRQLDRMMDIESDELKQESGRLENLEKEFIRREMLRKQAEEELQRKELERIEAARLSELKRIADEQAAREAEARRIADEAQRLVREAQEAAAKLAAEATNKRQREAAQKAAQEAQIQAEAARVERENQEAILKLQQATAALESQRIQEQAETATRIESKPTEITRAPGQIIRKKWKITQINDLQLLRARPDLIRKIEWDMLTINQELAEGKKLPGIIAEEDFTVGSRGGKAMVAIDI